MSDETKYIGIVLFEGVEELDAVGPGEVISFWCRLFPQDGWVVFTASDDGRLVDCAKGMRIQPDFKFSEMPPLDVLIYPGGQGTRPQIIDPIRLQWVRDQRSVATIMASVCTGSLVYAAAGILRGRPATTHWASLELLASLDSTIEVRETERFVDDGDVITSAGVSAGIDMALHLVDRLAGTNRAVQVDEESSTTRIPPFEILGLDSPR